MEIVELRASHNLKYSLEYAENEEKTSKKGLIKSLSLKKELLIEGINVPVTGAYELMKMQKEFAGKKDGIEAFEVIQSFDKSVRDKELVFRIGIETATMLWGDNYQIIVCTHSNTDTLHNHIIINSVGFDGKKIPDNREEVKRAREISDQICKKYNLPILDSPSDITHNKKYDYLRKLGIYTMNGFFVEEVVNIRKQARTDEEFLSRLHHAGYHLLIKNSPDQTNKKTYIMTNSTKYPICLEKYSSDYTLEYFISNKTRYTFQPWTDIPDMIKELTPFTLESSFTIFNRKILYSDYNQRAEIFNAFSEVESVCELYELLSDLKKYHAASPELRYLLHTSSKYKSEFKLIQAASISTETDIDKTIEKLEIKKQELTNQREEIRKLIKRKLPDRTKSFQKYLRNKLTKKIKNLLKDTDLKVLWILSTL